MNNEDAPAPSPAENEPASSVAIASEKKTGRDDFKAATKVLLAQRVGYLCSNPDCQKSTIGPKMGATGCVSIGIAAHIKAASPKGPRFDENQTVAERTSFENGIWLCSDDAHIIDHDEKHFTIELLQQWKRGAEERAFRQLVNGSGRATVLRPGDELAEELRELRAQLGLPEEQDLRTVHDRVATGALVQIEAFEATPRWPRHPVDLELAVKSTDRSEVLDVSRLPQVLMAVQRIVVISGPGTGKTTTLLQAARGMLSEGLIPLFVPLGEWAEGSADLLGWLIGRHGYEGLNVNYLKFLAHHGELALFLDGWNEVPAGSRRRLIKELDGLQRDYPLLNIVMSSRREALDVPLKGRRLDVLSLSEEQQTDIAHALKGDAGIRVLDTAWRTGGLRELVSIPLYLRALLEIADSGALPETKEEVLRRMVETHEAEPANAELFNRELLGFQRRYLTALATSAQKVERSTLPQKEARIVVAAVNKALIDEGETSTPPSAQDVLSKLVDAHSLIQDEEMFGFQHQQILEWFASLDLELALRDNKDDLTLDHPLVSGCLNEASWGETILFACERMARSDAAGISAIAAVVEILLKIDPLFAASVIRTSGPALWNAVGKTVSAFARAWHAAGRVDRAVAFMIETGQSEFADIVWPLVSSPDHQVQSQTIQLVRRFNPSVFGDRLKLEYSSLPDQARDTLVGELAYHGDSAGLDAALELALTEPSARIRYQAFAGLAFRGATTRVEDLLRQSGSELAELVAERGYLEAVHDKTLLADLERRKQSLVAAQSPEDRLARATASSPNDVLQAAVVSALQDPEFSFRDQRAYTLAEAASRVPDTVAMSLRWRVENGLDLPFRPFGYLDAVSPTDSGPIPGMVLNDEAAGNKVEYAAYLVGPQTVRELLGRFLATRRDFRAAGVRTKAAYAPIRKLDDLLENTRASVLFGALQTFSTGCTPAEIEDLCDVINYHGRHHDRESVPLSPEQREMAVALMNGWGRQLLDQGATRRAHGRLTHAMRRLPDPSQVSILAEMLDADLAALSVAKDVLQKNPRGRAALNEVRSSHSHDYRVTLTAIGTPDAEAVFVDHLRDPEFGIEAAVGLQVIWLERNEPRIKRASQPWPDFERAMINRTRDRATTTEPAEAILNAAELAKGDGTPEGRRRAMKLAGCAVLLPHGERADFYAELISAEVGPRAKLDLATRMLVGGLSVPSAIIKEALNQIVEALGERKWIADDQIGEIFDWVKLLPFSDEPDATLDTIDFLATKVQLPWLRMRDILPMVRHMSESQRVGLLRGLVQRFPELAGQYELFLALPNPGALSLDFLEELASGRFGEMVMNRGMPFDYPQKIHDALPAEERDRLLDRFAAAGKDRAKQFLASVLLAGSDHEAFLKLVSDPVGRRAISRTDWSTQQHLLYVHQPIGESTNHFELIPRDLRRLREGLFKLGQSGDAKTSAFALDYLNDIDEARDKEGGIDAGPRHPDIASGRAWPDIVIRSDKGGRA